MFAIDRGGLVGADGPTHAGSFDLSYLRCLPNTTVMTPADENECRQMLYTAFTLDTPSAVRYPRGSGPGVAVQAEMRALAIGKGELRRETKRRTHRVALLAFGSMLQPALAAAETLDATVANMRFVKPIDVELIEWLAQHHDYLVTVEENVVAGGAGSAVAEALSALGIGMSLLHLGLPDQFIDQGDPALLLEKCGLDAKGIASSVVTRYGVQPPEAVATTPSRDHQARGVDQPRRFSRARQNARPPRGESLVSATAPRADPRRTHGALPMATQTTILLPMNRPETISIPDVQSDTDARQISIDRVGIRGLRYPIQFKDADAVALPTVALCSVYVALPADRKGTHMSRMVSFIDDMRDAVALSAMSGLLSSMLQRLDAHSGRIEFEFPWFIRKAAPMSGVASMMDYQVTIAADLSDGKCAITATVVDAGHESCPSSKAISDYGAHNQRSHLTLTIHPRDGAQISLGGLVAIAEEEASCELYGLLKRADEKYVTERAYDRPRFVEDLVRGVAARLSADARLSAYRVAAENFESISQSLGLRGNCTRVRHLRPHRSGSGHDGMERSRIRPPIGTAGGDGRGSACTASAPRNGARARRGMR